MLPTTNNYYLPSTARRGQVALSLVFLIGGIALLVSVTLSLVAINFLNSTFAFQSANKAMAIALGGANDALLQLVRNPKFPSGNSGYSGGYDVCVTNLTTDCAHVVVTNPGGQVTIVSTATVFASQRKIQVLASINQSTGEISVSSLTILTL
jgi:uncharacterized protein (UPF0333 family)